MIREGPVFGFDYVVFCEGLVLLLEISVAGLPRQWLSLLYIILSLRFAWSTLSAGLRRGWKLFRGCYQTHGGCGVAAVAFDIIEGSGFVVLQIDLDSHYSFFLSLNMRINNKQQFFSTFI